MSVTSTVTLPAQPTDGTVDYVPLGGNGFNAPLAAYSVVSHAVTGDAGGGFAQLEVVMDDRFTSLIAYATLQNAQVASADADMRMVIAGSTGQNNVPLQVLTQPVVAISATVNANTLGLTWNPTPIVMPGGQRVGRLLAQMLNVLSDVYRLSMLVYIFDIRVRELTPMGPLLWSRGAT